MLKPQQIKKLMWNIQEHQSLKHCLSDTRPVSAIEAKGHIAMTAASAHASLPIVTPSKQSLQARPCIAWRMPDLPPSLPVAAQHVLRYA